MKNKTSKKLSSNDSSNQSSMSTRGRVFVGTVTSDKMHKTVTVEWGRRVYISKYERYAKKKSKVKAHNPNEIHAKKGDVVKIMETKPLSKTKNFTVIEIVGAQTKKESVKEESIQEFSGHDDLKPKTSEKSKGKPADKNKNDNKNNKKSSEKSEGSDDE